MSEISLENFERTLEALYNINVHAKKYASLAQENYTAGKKASARRNSVRKKALYRTKRRVLELLYRRGAVDRVEVHTIAERDYYCFYAGEWSFHTPIENWTADIDGAYVTRELDDFNKGEQKERSDMSLKASLLHLEDAVGVCANDHLEQEYVSYGHRRYFSGWKYLGD